jgi:hypothetical protein
VRLSGPAIAAKKSNGSHVCVRFDISRVELQRRLKLSSSRRLISGAERSLSTLKVSG